MKILHVTASIDPKKGGVSQAIRTIINGLEKSGIKNSVVCLDKREPVSNDSNLDVTKLGTTDNPWNYSALLIPWLRNHLKDYEVVIVHGLWLFHGFAVNKVIQQHPKNDYIKVFVMPHGMLDPYFQRASGRKLKAMRNTLYWKLIECKVVNNADGLLFTCQEEMKLASETFNNFNPKQKIVVGLGVEEPPQYTDQMRLAFWEKCPEVKGYPFLIFLSRIHEKKGIDLLIHAYSLVFQDSNSNQSIPKLVIAGPGIDTIYGQQIMKQISENAFLKNNIYLPGMLSGDAKWGAFYESEAFVLPSHQENFGIAVVEALACGKPVIISNQVNIWREIKDSKAGIIGNDTKEGTEEMLNVWQNLDKKQCKEMGIDARKCFEENFSLTLTSNNLIEKLSLI